MGFIHTTWEGACMSYTSKHELGAISSSISQYKDILLKDINLKIRLIDESEKNYVTTLLKWDDTTLTFAAPLYQRDWVIFAPSSQFECCFISKDSLYMTRIQLIRSNRTDTGLFYKASIIRPLEKKQQRSHFRLELLLDIYYAVLTNDKGEQLENIMKKSGACVNISAGGICIVSDDQLDSNQHLAIYFSFMGHDFVIPGKVLHKSLKNVNGTYTSRIQFQHLDSKNEHLLTKLIFEKQRMLMRKIQKPLYKKKS